MTTPSLFSTYHLVVLFAAMGGFLFGYDTSVINAAMFQMKNHFGFDLESWEAGLIVSIAIAGAFVGALGAGIGATAFGRKLAIGIADVLFIGGSVLLAAAPDMWSLMAGRFIIGLGIGIASVMIPVYLAEITPPSTRGRVITMNNAFLTGGQFIASGIGALFVYFTSDHLGWRVMFAIGAVPAVVQLLGLFALPESPRWLVLHGRPAEAAVIARKLGIPIAIEGVTTGASGDGAAGGSPSSPTSYNAIGSSTDPSRLAVHVGSGHSGTVSSTVNQEDKYSTAVSRGGGSVPIPSSPSSSANFSTRENFKRIFGPRLRRRLLIGCGLQLFQQLSGINTIMYYSSTILKKAGFDNDKDPVLLSVPLAFTNGLFTFLGMYLIERWGRRQLLIRSLLGCAVATVGMTAVGFLLDGHHVSDAVCGWSFMALLLLYLAFFAPGMGPVPWVVNAEIYPNALRSDAASVATMVNWSSNALVSQLFPILLGALGAGPTFAIVSGFVVLGIGFVVQLVPETKEVPLEDMGRLFGDTGDDGYAGADTEEAFTERAPLAAGF